MDTSKLKRFAQYARRYLMEQVATKLKYVLATDSPARRENPKAVEELERQIHATSDESVIEKIAYIWFNRFCAIRFMDVNRYTRIGILSPAEGQLQPEILAEAKMGHIDEEMVPETVRQRVFGLINGSTPSRDPQAEAYQLLIVACCNYYNRIMPFMFERIADYTELLIPDDLLSGNSILENIRDTMKPDTCRDVEVIGWLYQFYISEKKDEVFEGLKKNKKIAPENIPAATQLFTPHWIVRYLVENSLGRLWMLNRPNSQLIYQMDYYIKPESPEIDFLGIGKPEEIKLCDPAAGSGHMLTYSYDLLYAIYEEEGYEINDIPRLILENNLFGIEIDERAGELAAFALAMKAAKGNPTDEKTNHRHFFRNPVRPNICVVQNIHFDDGELKNYRDAIGGDFFTINLQTLLHQFREADNFGSLIRPEYTDAATILNIVEKKKLTSDLFLQKTHEKVLLALKQMNYLSHDYHVVIANPPYVGGKGMNGRMAAWAKDNYPESKSDLFAMFIERNLDLAIPKGYVAMITMQSWMFLSSFTKLRENLLKHHTLLSMAHLGARGFDSIGGEVVQTTAFVMRRGVLPGYKGDYLRLVDGENEAEKQQNFKNHRIHGPLKYSASADDFRRIPGSPIAYWLNKKVFQIFSNYDSLSNHCESGGRIKTHDNDNYMRFHWEIDRCTTNSTHAKWNLYENGGEALKWYGNVENVVDWRPESRSQYQLHGGLTNEKYWKREGITWNNIGKSGFRYKSPESEYSSVSPTAFPYRTDKLNYLLGFLNTIFSFELINIINPSLSNTIGDIFKLPVIIEIDNSDQIGCLVESCIDISRKNWDFRETSWDFTNVPLLHADFRKPTLRATYQKLRASWWKMTKEVQHLEEENNRIFIEAYGLQNELTPEVPLNEITLTCNPHYRYGNNKNEEELEACLLADTIKELISYAVGCMFGRYSLDKPGIILANQGETVEDYDKEVYGNSNGQLQVVADPNSVRLRPDSKVACFSCSIVMSSHEALFILADLYGTEYVSGRPMVYCRRCYEEKKDRISMVKPLSDFSLHEGLLNQWTGHDTFTQFLEMTRCFDYRTRPANEIASFRPDENNVIPILDEGWFTDDITERFRKFLKVSFGEEHYEENLAFIEEAIDKDIRKYFLKDFYNDHVKRYKKRPIYWLFSSPNGSFNALIYMHRYRSDTVSVILNDYLREFRTKLSARKEHLEQVSISFSASAREKTQAIKDLEKLRKMIEELDEYERDTLYPLATKQISIDLDDGVKVNYQKFGNALRKIPGLELQEE